MTVRLDPVLDLGRDTERMTSEDKCRQEATVNRLLQALAGPLRDRCEVQLLADEVGLGKTFVALATAYSLLRVVRTQPDLAAGIGLGKCYRAVVVVVPSGNHALASKWHQEIEALRTRCSTDTKETDWFHSKICDNAYDLVEGLQRATDLRRDSRKNPCVLICTANAFRRRVGDPGERLRFLAACLFRWWGNKFSRHERYRIVSRAGEVRGFSSWTEYARRVGAGSYEVDLWDFREHAQYLSPLERSRWNWPVDRERLYQSTPFTFDEIVVALERLAQDEVGHDLLYGSRERIRDGFPEPEGLLPYCRDAAERRGHAEWYFDGFKSRLVTLYKNLAPNLLRQQLPMVIVDEAHHWRHSQRQDCQDFKKYLAPLCRRLLLLTATPFQMHRDELLEVLSVGDAMTPAIGENRVAHLQRLRERIRQAMAVSESAGVDFSREWGDLTEQFARLDARFDAANCWLPGEKDPRTSEIAGWWDELAKNPDSDSPNGRSEIPGPLKSFFARAVELQASNAQLGTAMRQLIIRHRRGVAHRRVWVGREYPGGLNATRPDQHLLHLAPGATVPPNAELSQYLLMKVVAEASRGKHRTTLGMDLTGSYSTLWQSKEGEKAIKAALSGSSKRLLRLLQQITGYRASGENQEDGRHPKVQLVVAEVLDRWRRGEKSLIFCFRVPTAKTLARLLSSGVDQELKKSRRLLIESRGTLLTDQLDEDKAMQQFRRALTARDSNGVSLFLDRVLLGWFQLQGLPSPILTDDDRRAIAYLYARGRHLGMPLRRGDRIRPDRVFLNRAVEYVWAERLLAQEDAWSTDADKSCLLSTRRLLEIVADPSWLKFRYGKEVLSQQRGAAGGEESAPTDWVARSSISARYELDPTSDPVTERMIRDALHATPTVGRLSLAPTLVSGPNLFVPLGTEILASLNDAALRRVGEMLRLVFSMTFFNDEWRWEERAKVLDAVVRALLREDILLRLPPSVFRDDDETWAASILRGLHESPGRGQLEPLAGRVEEFLRELMEMGPSERESHLRYSMNARAEAVVLVTGDTKNRDAVFNGFNAPLLPDILVCTQVGQEGIDLHRHCSHVVHYDLGWNPATLEQRTGRVDRIGSKTLRERRLAIADLKQQGFEPNDANLPGLDIALPYLAGTYDERMFDRLRSRSQTFEILTGGDPTADRDNEISWLDPDDVGRSDGIDYVPLPLNMLEQLRVNLGVL